MRVKMNSRSSNNLGVLIISVALLIMATTMTSGCHKTTSTNPAVVRAVTLLDAENTVNAIAHGLQTANGTLAAMRESEPEYYEYAHSRIVAIAFLNDRANADIVAAKNGSTLVDWKSSVAAIARSVGDTRSLTAFGFKNAKSQQEAQLGLATLITALGIASQYQ